MKMTSGEVIKHQSLLCCEGFFICVECGVIGPGLAGGRLIWSNNFDEAAWQEANTGKALS